MQYIKYLLLLFIAVSCFNKDDGPNLEPENQLVITSFFSPTSISGSGDYIC